MKTILLLTTIMAAPLAHAATVAVAVDAQAGRHPISPLIYGVNFGTGPALLDMGATLNRYGGNATSLYNYLSNTLNTGNDYFYESFRADGGAAPGAWPDSVVGASRAGHATAMVTIPLTGRTAKRPPGPANLYSFSVRKYGAQTATDPYLPDAGNGQLSNGQYIAGNDRDDATTHDTVSLEQPFVSHLVGKWGAADHGGVRYYLTDNEPGIWHATHRDIWPQGVHGTEFLKRTLALSALVKAADPSAQVAGPEEWSYLGYIYDGYDRWYADLHHDYATNPDHTTTQHTQDWIPWLLAQWKKAGHPIDALTVHYYPQGAEFSNDVSTATQLLRNRSTRALWDPAYVSEDYNHAKIALVRLLLHWVAAFYYPGTPVGVTEYSWGADDHINGATAQADILGIFGRENLTLAARWVAPADGTPVYDAFKIYRNYDGAGAQFGETSIQATAPDPDTLSAFAATRAADSALTLVLINKTPDVTRDAAVTIRNFGGHGTMQRYQLQAGQHILRLADSAWTANGASVAFDSPLPAQSVTVAVLLPAR